jgi:hypothetical protein
MNGEMYREILDENLLQDLRQGQSFTFQQDTAKTLQEWLRDKSLNVFEWPSQSLELNLIKHLWRDLKIVLQRCSPSNLTDVEGIYREEWEKLPKASSPGRLEAVIAAKGASTKYLVNGLNTYVIVIFHFCLHLIRLQRNRVP